MENANPEETGPGGDFEKVRQAAIASAEEIVALWSKCCGCANTHSLTSAKVNLNSLVNKWQPIPELLRKLEVKTPVKPVSTKATFGQLTHIGALIAESRIDPQLTEVLNALPEKSFANDKIASFRELLNKLTESTIDQMAAAWTEALHAQELALKRRSMHQKTQDDQGQATSGSDNKKTLKTSFSVGPVNSTLLTVKTEPGTQANVIAYSTNDLKNGTMRIQVTMDFSLPEGPSAASVGGSNAVGDAGDTIYSLSLVPLSATPSASKQE